MQYQLPAPIASPVAIKPKLWARPMSQLYECLRGLSQASESALGLESEMAVKLDLRDGEVGGRGSGGRGKMEMRCWASPTASTTHYW